MSKIKGKLNPLKDKVFVSDMNFDEEVTAAGIVLQSDNGKGQGVKPRWGRVWAVGPEQKDVKVGEWILMEHARWTREFEYEMKTVL
jgi:co-chaperonin GroES (HSP10)